MVSSGPPYPRYAPGAAPGENAFGSFVFGGSPFGTIPSFDIWQTIISQYANSKILTTLIENIFEYLDQTKNFDAFFDNIWNIDTAQGKGLDIWGAIIGVGRTLQVPVGEWFGFQEASPGPAPFNQGAFYSGSTLTDNFLLSDDAYRVLILAKAAANITDGSIPSINRILMSLFPNRGNCYVVDNLDMSMEYKFEFSLTPVELAIVGQSGALPKPTGVSATVVVP